MELEVDQIEKPTTSWKDKLVGSSPNSGGIDLKAKEDFELLEGDAQKSFINGIPSIEFSNRIQHVLIWGMDNTVILKLLGRNIGFSVLQNQIYNLWKHSLSFHLMDIENGYFLPKFDNKFDCKRFSRKGPLGYMYKHKILVETGGLVGKVTKLDLNIDNRIRGRFTRMAVYVNLNKPLVSHIIINGKIQKVEYEFLTRVYFHCGRYGHMKDVCLLRVSEPRSEKHPTSSETLPKEGNMIVN
ncbi:hypothetical protein Goari_023625 [Gossypium aridum]|uniref:DUF4283 domain-containing protein n=1 Tax=Gossypium aridum TaxID=34290 RepID=A0A7J8X3S0_GOSAI|nr:hypothetical protein [Gossypium aridum]